MIKQQYFHFLNRWREDILLGRPRTEWVLPEFFGFHSVLRSPMSVCNRCTFPALSRFPYASAIHNAGICLFYIFEAARHLVLMLLSSSCGSILLNVVLSTNLPQNRHTGCEEGLCSIIWLTAIAITLKGRSGILIWLFGTPAVSIRSIKLARSRRNLVILYLG